MPENNSSLRKILIVEDEKPFVDTLTYKLSQSGYKTIVARDGKEGLAKFLSEKPDLILLDLYMPNMDGKTMLEKLRREHKSSVPVLVLTNLDLTKETSKVVDEGIVGYFLKADTSLDDIVETVRKTLSK